MSMYLETPRIVLLLCGAILKQEPGAFQCSWATERISCARTRKIENPDPVDETSFWHPPRAQRCSVCPKSLWLQEIGVDFMAQESVGSVRGDLVWENVLEETEQKDLRGAVAVLDGVVCDPTQHHFLEAALLVAKREGSILSLFSTSQHTASMSSSRSHDFWGNIFIFITLTPDKVMCRCRRPPKSRTWQTEVRAVSSS